MDSVERIKNVCRKKNIPIYRLERDLGFSNGYIGSLSKGNIRVDRLIQIADYLNVSIEYLIYGTTENITEAVAMYRDPYMQEIYEIKNNMPLEFFIIQLNHLRQLYGFYKREKMYADKLSRMRSEDIGQSSDMPSVRISDHESYEAKNEHQKEDETS